MSKDKKPKAEPRITMTVTIQEGYAHQAEWDAWWRMMHQKVLRRMAEKQDTKSQGDD
jgi:hypothetical protein